MKDVKTIHILGGAGSGATTLARALALKYGFRFIDVDEIMWEKTDPPFTVRRSDPACAAILEDELAQSDKNVISGAFVGWGDRFIPRLDIVVYLHLPEAVRMERIRRREHDRFGSRVDPGGDMHRQDLDFLDWASRYDSEDGSRRSRAQHEGWIAALSCPVVRIETELPLAELLAIVGSYLE